MTAENKKTESNENNAEKSTKARIIDASIDLFSQRGFDAVSMQEIADAVGIKKASLYYHFTSKDQILKEVLEYPMAQLGVIGPQGATPEQMIQSMGLDGFLAMSREVVLNWMDAPYVEKIMRITFVELYHNDQVKEYFTNFTGAAFSFWTQNFTIMIEKGMVKSVDPVVLAGEYLSFYTNSWIEFFLHRYDPKLGSYRDRYQNALDKHNAFLIEVIRAE